MIQQWTRRDTLIYAQAATRPGGEGEDAGRRCVARLAATMDAALALEAAFVDYSELPGAIDDIAARFGLPTVNVSRVAGVDAKAGVTYDESRAATKRAALPEELWAWAAPHLSPLYEALCRR